MSMRHVAPWTQASTSRAGSGLSAGLLDPGRAIWALKRSPAASSIRSKRNGIPLRANVFRPKDGSAAQYFFTRTRTARTTYRYPQIPARLPNAALSSVMAFGTARVSSRQGDDLADLVDKMRGEAISTRTRTQEDSSEGVPPPGNRNVEPRAARALMIFEIDLRVSWFKTWVELVRLYSNPKAGLEALPKLLGRARSTARTYERTAARQVQVRLDAQQANDLAIAYRSGKATKELAGRFGIHRATVTAILRRLGVDLRQQGLTDEQVAEACRLYPEGWSLARLAERFDVDDMTVRRYLLLTGIVIRAPHDRIRKS